MHIHILPHLGEITKDIIQRKNVVVIDVFRATSVIVTALANHVKEVIVKSDVQNAINEFEKRKGINCVIAGERNMEKILGFHYGNSPIAYLKNKDILGKTLILTTTNGTRAINLCQGALNVYICSMLNSLSVALRLVADKKDVIVICSGSKETFSLDDGLCAGLLVYNIRKNCNFIEDEFAKYLCQLYEDNKDNLRGILRNCDAYNALLARGYEDDVNFCLMYDLYNIVPMFRDDKIV